MINRQDFGREARNPAGFYDSYGYAPREGEPVYRLFNPYTTDHHYTRDYNEYMVLGNRGWEQEGIGWYGVLP